MESVGARYGIWSFNPVGPDIGTKALGIAEGVGKLLQDRYKIMQERLAAQQAERTLEGKVNLENLKNATDAEYYPQLAQAGLGEKQATIGNINAHSRLFGAQGEEARARAAFENMRARLGMGGLLAASGGLAAGNTMPQVDKNGNITTVELPTTPAATQAQNRIAAEAELKQLMPIVTKGMQHYAGISGKLDFIRDISLYKTQPNTEKGKAAAQRLYEYDLAQRYSTEIAGINARQATGQAAGEGALREFKNSMFRNSPFIPQDITRKTMGAYSPLQQSAVNAAIEQERTGFPQTLNQPPLWAQGGIQLNPMGMNLSGGRSGVKQGIVQSAPQQSTIDLSGISDDELRRIAGGGQ